MVEDVVKKEHATCPNKPIYLLGSSFGGCLALAVAARNPHIDLILVLVNPGMQEINFFIKQTIRIKKNILTYMLLFFIGTATSFENSDIQKLLSVISMFSDHASMAITALLNYNIGKYLEGFCRHMNHAW